MASRIVHSKEYNLTKIAYVNAKQRCQNPNHPSFKNYGAKGITFEFNNFDEFVSDIGIKPEGLTLDRINNKEGYKKGNVRWVTRKENQQNTKNSCYWFVDGVKFCSLSDAAKQFKVDNATIIFWCKGGKTSQGYSYPPKDNHWVERKYK